MNGSVKGIVFFDVDGTIIDCRKGIDKPSAKTKEAIKRLKENGYLTILCTGRPLSFLDESLLNLGLDGFITSNGTYVKLNDKEVLNDSIDKEMMNEIIDHLDKEKIDYILESQEMSYINSFETNGSKTILTGFSLPLESITDKWDRNDIYVSKIAIIDDGQPTFNDFMKKYENEFVFMQHPGQTSYDMYRRGYTKAYGIKHLIEILDIPKNHTYAFGDGENDIEMFQFVEHGIAMGGSHENLIPHAYDHTDDVKNEGIYNYLIKAKMI